MIGGLDGNRMLLGLAVGIIVLIFLVLKTKVQAFLALIVCTVIVGVVGGMPLSNITREALEALLEVSVSSSVSAL